MTLLVRHISSVALRRCMSWPMAKTDQGEATPTPSQCPASAPICSNLRRGKPCKGIVLGTRSGELGDAKTSGRKLMVRPNSRISSVLSF